MRQQQHIRKHINC